MKRSEAIDILKEIITNRYSQSADNEHSGKSMYLSILTDIEEKLRMKPAMVLNYSEEEGVTGAPIGWVEE
jgi:hypothetical protein